MILTGISIDPFKFTFAGYEIFAVQFYGECWGGKNAGLTYNRYGLSSFCWKGVGRDLTNMVYRLRNS